MFSLNTVMLSSRTANGSELRNLTCSKQSLINTTNMTWLSHHFVIIITAIKPEILTHIVPVLLVVSLSGFDELVYTLSFTKLLLSSFIRLWRMFPRLCGCTLLRRSLALPLIRLAVATLVRFSVICSQKTSLTTDHRLWIREESIMEGTYPWGERRMSEGKVVTR